jgi:SAM-dependent methyltransferase
VLKKFKNFIIDKKIYWKLRHLINPGVWEQYYENSLSKRRDFYSEFIQRKHIKAIFEFGCASGPNLFNIDNNVPWDLYYFGYDISSAAIKFARKKTKINSYFFSTKISNKLFESKLNSWKIKKFDLSIYDRVLYLLSEIEVRSHFEEYKDFMNYLIIDDFHNSNKKVNNKVYFSKNYEKILLDIGFKLIKDEASGHFSGNDDFFKRNARRLIFQKE